MANTKTSNGKKKSSSNIKVNRGKTHTTVKGKGGTVTVKNSTLTKLIVVIVVLVVIAAIVLFALHFTGKIDIKAILKNTSTQTQQENTPSGGGSGNNNSGSNNTSNLVTGQGDLAVRYLDVGQGDGILIELPDGKEMLIDCGQTKKSLSYEQIKANYLDIYIEDGIIEYLVVTHSDSDHVSYMDKIFDEYQVSNVYMPYILATPTNASLQTQIAALDQEKVGLFKDKDTINTAVYAKFFIAALSEPNCTIHINADTDENTTDNVINADDNTYKITFICPTFAFYENTDLKDAHAINAVSPVMILEYNSKKLVFTGDCNAYWNNKGELKENEGNEWFMVRRIKTLYGDSGIDCDVLKVAHHGAGEASSNEFLNVISCEYAVISCALENSHNHPRQAALDRMKEHNMIVYRTDLNGTIVCVINKDG
nr:MBL fold metallo-hydrolase [Clostridia bacterium]